MPVISSVSPGVVAAIAAAASVGAALLAAIASYSVARVRLREVRLTYDQKLHENYLATARGYTTTIYVPLSIALTHLSAAFSTFRSTFTPKGDPPNDAISSFRHSIHEFLDVVAGLTERGADAFLTTALEDALISFTTFLRISLEASEPRVRLVYEYRLSLPGMSAGVSRQVTGSAADAAYRATRVGLALPGFRASVRADRLIAAPISSSAFERRVVEDLAQIKTQIKEVTLGAHAGPS